jgi:hypothetical protein
VRARALGALVWGALLIGAPTAHAAGPPIISETWVEEVKADSARLRAKINPNGLATTYRFEITTQATFEAKGFEGATLIPVSGPVSLGAGSSFQFPAQFVGPPLTPLQPATLYRYRVTAKHSAESAVFGTEHVFATQQNGLSFKLPDQRGWEMVSPLDKGGGAIAAPEALFGGGDIQAASQGGGITYGSATSFGEAQGAPPVNQYLSMRTPSGWATQNLSAPLSSAAYGDEPDGAPYRLFSTDLSKGLLFGGLPCRGGLPGCPSPPPVIPGSGAPSGFMAYYLRSAGSYASLLDGADLLHTSVDPEAFSVSFAGATEDLSHIVLSSCAALTSNATEVPDGSGGCEASAQNLYEWSGGSLSAISLLPGESTTTPGQGPIKLAAPIGAISSDGSKVYFTATEDGLIYLRDGTQTKPVSSAPAAQFQTASTDGAIAYLTEGGHLIRYLASTGAKTDLTPAGGVTGVLGASNKGNVVYFQDAAGIERWSEGAKLLVAAGPEAAKPSDYLRPPGSATARVSADGAHLAFLSTKELSGYDNASRAELYLYGPPLGSSVAKLICASCNPGGEKPVGSASIPGVQANGSTLAYLPRALSADGNRVFFESTDKLLFSDSNGQPDVYQWETYGEGDCTLEPGCLSPISSGRGTEGASFIDASADGTDAYFLTSESLVGSDPGSIDLYDARVGGGLPEASRPLPCIADACQPLPSPPEDPDPSTLIKTKGNPAPQYAGEAKKKKHKHHHKPKHHHKRGRGR